MIKQYKIEGLKAICKCSFQSQNDEYLYQSKMRKNKNISSTCQTTTLLTLSNITIDQPGEPFTRSGHQNHLIDKIRELQQILEKTNHEKFLLIERQEQLLDHLANKKNLLDRINHPVYQTSKISDEIQDDPNESLIDEEMMNTCKINQITQCMKNRQGKTHHKFYSAIQSPTVTYSPHHYHDQITLNSYRKSKLVKTAAPSQTTGLIRKQKEKYNYNRSYQSSGISSINFKSIDQIWNEVGTTSSYYNSKQKPHKTFLAKVD